MAKRTNERPRRTDHELTPETLGRLLQEAERCPDFSVIAGRAGFSLRHLYQFFNAGLMQGADPLCAELAAGIMAARAEVTGLAFEAMCVPLKRRTRGKTKTRRLPTDAETRAGVLHVTKENEILEVDAKHALEVYRELRVDVMRIEEQIPSVEDKQVTEAELVKQLSPPQRAALLAALAGMDDLALDDVPAPADEREPEHRVDDDHGREDDDQE